jgi:magnesium chelatase subunit D
MEVVKRNLHFEADPEAFLKDSEPIQKKLRDLISHARKKLTSVKIPPKLLETVCRTCLDLKVDGLRPDIVISKAAVTLAAFEDRDEVALGDILVASELALSHRTREGGFKDPATPEEIKETLLSAAKTVGYVPQKTSKASKEGEKKGSGTSKDTKKEGRAVVMVRGEMNKRFRDFLRKHKTLFERWKAASSLFTRLNRALGQVIFAFGRRTKMKVKGVPKVKAVVKSDKPLQADEGEEGKDVYLKKMKGIPSVTTATRSPQAKKGVFLFRVFQGSKKISGLIPDFSFRTKNVDNRRIGSFGKRADAITASGRGRATGWRYPKTKPRDIHLPATIRAAARKRALMKSRLDPAFRIDLQDIREKLRRYKAPLIIVFVLDLSGSMMLNIVAVKQAILKLHGDAYRFRDRVGIVALKDTGAVVVQHPITNLRVVANRLMALKISGYTPIASGMLKAWEVLRESKRRDPSAVPVMVLITDGSANVPLQRSLETGEVRTIEEPRIIVREYEDLAIHDALFVAKMIRREGINTIVINTNPRLYGRETFGFTVTEQIAKETRGKLHMVGRLASEEQVVDQIMEKVAEDQRLIAADAS